MSGTLAIYTPAIGVPSETFIRRHIEQLWPGRVVVICDTTQESLVGSWKVDCPVFCTTTRINWAARLARERFNRGKLLPVCDPLKLFLKRHRVSVVLAEYLDNSLPLFRSLSGSDIKFFVHAHGFDVARARVDNSLQKSYLAYSDSSGVLVMSEAAKALLSSWGIPANRIAVCHYGVEVPETSVVQGNSKRETICLAVGRMTSKKAPILLLESFRRAYQQCPSLRLDYVGGGELLAAAMQYVECCGLGEVVRLHGVKDSCFVQEMMRKADIFLQHSATDPTNGDMEGLPVAILEAMANGLPVVSTRHAGIPEQVVEGETGLLVEELDVGAMAEGIVRLAQSPDLRRSMGEAGYLRAKEHFSWELNRKRLCEVMGLEP